MPESDEPNTPIADAEREIRESIDKCKANPAELSKLIDDGTVEMIVRLRFDMAVSYGKDLRDIGKLWERILMSRPTEGAKDAKAKKAKETA